MGEAADWFFENTDAVFIEVRDARAVRISPGWTAMLGWSEADALGRPIWEFVHPEDLHTVRDAVITLMKVGRVTYEHRVLSRSGAYLWMRVRSKLAADQRGLVIMQDITDERRRAAETAEIARANSLLNRAAGIHLWRYDPVTDTSETDPDFSQPFLETDPAKRIPSALVEAMVHRADLGRMQGALATAVTTGELVSADFRSRDNAGGWRNLRNACVGTRRLPCGRHEIIGMSQDLTELMTERDRALAGEKAARAAHGAKNAFLANISHELRTPLYGVLGALHLIDSSEPDEQRRLLHQAIQSGEALSELVSDLIDFADCATGVVRVEQAPSMVAPLVDGMAARFAGQAAEKGVDLSASGPADRRLWIDGPKIRQILRALLSNAVKYTDAGKVEIRWRVDGAATGSRLEIAVSDTGIGIGSDVQARMFECFDQADNTPTRAFGGAGLGLARARQLATLMDGDIVCESRPGKGSTFRLSLPAEAAEVEPTSAALAPDRGPLRVLVVDDNAVNRMLVCKMLSALDIEALTSHDGAEAVAAAASEDFDLILMDIQMPVMDGVEATRRIRALPPPRAGARIVALTANVLPQDQIRYRAVGMNGVLAKPLSPHALISELGRLQAPAEQVA